MGMRLVLFVLMVSLGGAAWAQTGGEEGIREIGSLRRGEFATVRGEVIRFREYDEIRIADGTGRIDVYLGEPDFSGWPFEVGDMLTISGRVDDDVSFQKELYAREIVLEDGTVLSGRANY